MSGAVFSVFRTDEERSDRAVQWAEAMLDCAVLRRALAIAARERVGFDTTPDAGLGLMLTWVMQAADEIDRSCAPGPGCQCQRDIEREP